MFLDDLSDYLSSGGITGTIFTGVMMDTPDAAVGLYETGGTAPTHAMNPNPGQAVVERPSVQVVCRAAADDYAAARTKAQAIFVLLDGLPTRTINGVAYKWGAARQSPFLMGRDESGRVLVACNFDVVKAMST